MTRFIAILVPIGILVACSGEPTEDNGTALALEGESGNVDLVGADGATLGSVTITQDANGTTLDLRVTSGLEEGMHGVHLHEAGLCETPDFTSAGGHWNPEGTKHGRDNPQGAHVGDLANMAVGPDGKGQSTFLVENVLVEGGAHAMADADGTALVVHAGPDDYVTDPSGDSGARVACAVIATAG